MISSEHRFHGYGSLRYVYNRGKTVRSQFLSLRYVENRRRSEYRAAVVVSRKVHKSAVIRNRIRRRVYEALRQYEPRIKSPYDLVFTVYSEQVADMDTEALQRLVGAQLQKAGIVSL